MAAMSEVHEEEKIGLMRRFQRPILLGVVIFALLTFSITGAALMMLDPDPTEVAIVLPDGTSTTVGGKSDQELERASLNIVRDISGMLLNYRDMLDRADEEMRKSNQVLQSLLEFPEFQAWLPFLSATKSNARRNREGISFDDYTILAGAAMASGIRISSETIADKTQALLQLNRAAGGEQAADFDEEMLHRRYNLRAAGFKLALERALAATEFVRRLELGLEAIPTPEEVLAGWKKTNPVVRATVAVFAASLYEEEARRVFEMLFPTEEERQAEIRRWRDDSGLDSLAEVDEATKTRREKLRVENLDKRKDAVEAALAEAEAAVASASGDEAKAAAEVRVRAARRDLLLVNYLDKLVDRRTTYSGGGDEGSGKSASVDFEGRRWLLFGLDLDALTEAQNDFLLAWIKEKGIEEPTLKEVAEHYRKYAYTRFLTDEGKLSRNIAPFELPEGGAMPREQEGAAAGSGSGEGGQEGATPPPTQDENTASDQGPAGPAPAVPPGMLATSDRPDQQASKDIYGWDEEGVQKRAKADLVAKRFLTRFRDVVVSPALEAETANERKTLIEAEAALTEASKAVDALVQRSREINTALSMGGDGRGLQGYLELKRSEDSDRTELAEFRSQVERLEKLPEAQREDDYAKKLEEAKKRFQTAEQDLARSTEALNNYLVQGLPRVRASLLNGRAAGVTSALSMLGFGELVAKSGETTPAAAADEALKQVWNALSAAEQNEVGGSAAFDAADQSGKLDLLVRAVNGTSAHSQAGAVDAAWRAVARAKLSAIVSAIETKRQELQATVAPALASVSDGVDRLAALQAEIPALDASLESQDRALASKREELARATDDAIKTRLQGEIDALQTARDAQAADRAAKVEERNTLTADMPNREQAFEAQRAAAFEASADWNAALDNLEVALRAIELADPSIASLAARSAAVEAAKQKLTAAEASQADVSTLDKLRVDLVALLERRLEAYEKRRTLNSQAAARAAEVKKAYETWRDTLDPVKAAELQALLVEYSEWGPKNTEALKIRSDVEATVEAARNTLEAARIAALPIVLERLSSELRAESGAAALDLVVQQIPGWITREDLSHDFERNSSDLPEAGGNPIVEGALFGPAGQLEEGGLGKEVAISQRYALLPGLLDAGGESTVEALARRGYLRELAGEIARIRAAMFSEMLDEIERIDDVSDETNFIAGSEVKREDFERELREGIELYHVKGAAAPSQEIQFQRYFVSQGRGYYRWNNGPLNPDWFRRVTSVPVRNTFNAIQGELDEIEGEQLSAQPYPQADLDAWIVSHVARRPLDPEVDDAAITPRDWLSTFRELRTERMAKSVQETLTGEGLRKTFQISRR